MATDTTEIVVISILAVVATVCLVVVVLLVRWLKNVAFAGVDARTGERRFGGNDSDSDSESSIVDDISLFAPSEGGGDQALTAWESDVISKKKKKVGLGSSPSKPHDPFDDYNDFDPDRASPAGGWNPIHTGHPSAVMNAMSGNERDVIIPPARAGGLTFGYYRIVQGRKSTKSLFLSKADVSKGLGIVLKGDAPVSICEVECDGPSWIGGLRVDDVFTSVNGTPCVNSSHKTVIALVSKALQKLQSEDDQDHRGVRGHAMSMVVTAQDARPDAAISDVNISLPGQAWGDDDAGGGGSKAGDGADDPFAPIREAASQHQLEAARLMQTGNFKQARILLDRAIELLQSIPKSHENSPQKASPSKGPHGSPRRKAAGPDGAGKSTKRRSKKENRGFVPVRAGANKADMVSLLSTRNTISPLRPSRVRAAKPWRATIIMTSAQIPSTDWKPIKPAKLSKRRHSTARRRPVGARKPSSSSRSKGAARAGDGTTGSTKRSGPSATRAAVNGAPMPSASAWGGAAFNSPRNSGYDGFGGFELNAPASKRNSYTGDSNEAYGFGRVGVG